MTKRDTSSNPPSGTDESPQSQAPKPRNTFSKAERLCKRLAFERLFAKGSSFNEGPWWVIFESPFPQDLTTAPLMIGISVPKRNFKAAVKRNRIKRLVREAYRKDKHLLLQTLQDRGQSFAFLVKFTGRRLPTAEETQRAFRSIFQRFMERL